MNNEHTIPVDSTARRVVFSKGFSYEFSPSNKRISRHSDLPIPQRPKAQTSKGNDDLTGVVFGRFTVVGQNKVQKKRTANQDKRGSGWVCRCSCGKYEVRTRRAIMKSFKGNYTAQCEECEALRNLKRRDHFNQYGFWPDEKPPVKE